MREEMSQLTLDIMGKERDVSTMLDIRDKVGKLAFLQFSLISTEWNEWRNLSHLPI